MRKKEKMKNICSFLYLIFALILVCGVYLKTHPDVNERLKDVAVELNQGRAQEVFCTFADCMEMGLPLEETLWITRDLILDDEN